MRCSCLTTAVVFAAAFSSAFSNALHPLSAAVIFTGELTTSDPAFNRPASTISLSGLGNAVAYDTYTFVADAAGPYRISGDYAAGGLDGYVYLYSSSFNAATPLIGLLAADDNYDPDGGGPIDGSDYSRIPSSESYGPAATAATLTLTPGLTYTLVVTAFNDSIVVDGVGPYTVTVTGGSTVPEPTSIFLLGMLALCLHGSRNSRSHPRVGAALNDRFP